MLPALVLIGLVLVDAFETIVLPRRIAHRLRFTRLFYQMTWGGWAAPAHRLHGAARETYLSYYGPLSLISLLVLWAAGLTAGFALLYVGVGADMRGPEGPAGFGGTLYMSGVTLFTLGFGDITPHDRVGRAVAVMQAGTGFGFLALVIGYLPVIYQAFSRREVSIALLDARAGSPPSGVTLLCRVGCREADGELVDVLRDWERWSAELLESHLSYPVLAFYRSQHDGQSWLAALTAVLDASALVLAGMAGRERRAGQLTFAMARHAAVDLSQLFRALPSEEQPALPDRLSPAERAAVWARLRDADVPLGDALELDERLSELCGHYEPYVKALAARLLMPLPPWLAPDDTPDDWQRTDDDHDAVAPAAGDGRAAPAGRRP